METDKGRSVSRRDIWQRSIETICNWTKRSLLEYVEAIMESCRSNEERERLVKIKKSIHQQMTQAQLQMATLFLSYSKGGSIEPFEDILRPEQPMSRNDRPRDAAEVLFRGAESRT